MSAFSNPEMNAQLAEVKRALLREDDAWAEAKQLLAVYTPPTGMHDVYWSDVLGYMIRAPAVRFNRRLLEETVEGDEKRVPLALNHMLYFFQSRNDDECLWMLKKMGAESEKYIMTLIECATFYGKGVAVVQYLLGLSHRPANYDQSKAYTPYESKHDYVCIYTIALASAASNGHVDVVRAILECIPKETFVDKEVCGTVTRLVSQLCDKGVELMLAEYPDVLETRKHLISTDQIARNNLVGNCYFSTSAQITGAIKLTKRFIEDMDALNGDDIGKNDKKQRV